MYLGGSHLAVLSRERGGGGRIGGRDGGRDGGRGEEKGRGSGTITQDKEQNLT